MIKICMILFPEFQMLAHVLASETLRIANVCAQRTTGDYLCNWQLRSATKDVVQASNGALMTPDENHWHDAKSFDLVLLCTGDEPPKVLSAGLRAFLKQANRNGAVLGGLGSGAVILARMGFLDGRSAVLPDTAGVNALETWPSVAPSDSFYCLDGNRLTAAGGTSTEDALLAWIASVSSPELANATAEAMVHGATHATHGQQRLPESADPVLQQMNALMQTHSADPLPLTEIAAQLGLSLKQLRLRCQRGLGVSPSMAYQNHRLKMALDLVRNTEMPITEIAQATGFASIASFSKSFRARYKAAPSKMRVAMARGAKG